MFKDSAAYEKFISPLIGMKGLTAAQMQGVYDFDFAGAKSQVPIDGERPKPNPNSRL